MYQQTLTLEDCSAVVLIVTLAGGYLWRKLFNKNRRCASGCESCVSAVKTCRSRSAKSEK